MSNKQIHALWHVDNQQSEIRESRIRVFEEEFVIKSRYSLISMGTELLIARGLVPPELSSTMKVPYMDGDLMLPVKYGYSLVGRAPGYESAFHIMHPHQDVCVVNRADAFAIPDEVPLKRATLASNLETALTAVWDGNIKPGERALVVGFGMIGALTARLISLMPGCLVDVYDVNPARQAYASEFGFGVIEDPKQSIEPYDVSFHCSASSNGLQLAIDLLAREGRVVELSWYGVKAIELSLGYDFHSLRKRIISSQVGSIPASMSHSWSMKRRKQTVFELLKNPIFDQHITHELTLEEAAGRFGAWRQKSPTGLGYVIKY